MSSLRSCVDEITRGRVFGWVLDSERPRQILTVAVTVDGREVVRRAADVYREGLDEYGGDGHHGFIIGFDPPLSVFEEHLIEVSVVDPPEMLPGGSKKLSAPRVTRADGDMVPLILTSTGRAGTTLLMSEFVHQPGIVVAGQYPFETKLLSYYAAAFRALAANEDRVNSTDPDRMFATENQKIIGHNPYNAPGHHSFARDRARFEAFFEEAVPARLATLFRDLVLQYYELAKTDSGKPSARFFAEKGVLDQVPRQAARLFFGDVREIITVRDPRDLMCSAMSFWKYTNTDALKTLNEMLPQLEAIHEAGATDTFFVRYEDLIQHPEASRRAIYRFIGLEPGEEATVDIDSDLFKAHGTSRDPAASVGRWRTELSREEIAACDRLFASFLHRFGYSPAQALPRGPSVALEVTFGTNGNSRAYLREGWSQPEVGFTWTLGSQSRLELPKPAPAGNYMLELRVRPFVWENTVPAQRMTISVNDVSFGGAIVERPDVLKVPLPWTVLAAKTSVTIVLSLPNAAKPSEIQGTEDKRQLAFAFEKLTLLAGNTSPDETLVPVPAADASTLT
jgi:hypothetical protein